MIFRLSHFLIASGIALSAGLWTTPAKACSPDICVDSSERFSSFESVHATVAPNGVIVFDTNRGTKLLTEAEALAHVSLTLSDGQETYEGAFEYIEAWELTIWRPTLPFPVGAELNGMIFVDNDTLDPETKDLCSDNIEQPIAVQVGQQELPPLTALEFTSEQLYEIGETKSLETIVCCDNAYPADDIGGCSGGIYWSEGSCKSTVGKGYVTASYLWPEPQELDVLADRRYRLGTRNAQYKESEGLAATLRDSEPFCVTPEIISMSTGETIFGTEQCFGDDILDQLGDLQLDPTEELEAVCEGELYTCEEGANFAWDREMCEPWVSEDDTETGGTETAGSGSETGGSDSETGGSDSDSDTGSQDDTGGCACNTSTPEPTWGWLGLLAIFGLRRRRSV